jgi:hypothetical protein
VLCEMGGDVVWYCLHAYQVTDSRLANNFVSFSFVLYLFCILQLQRACDHACHLGKRLGLFLPPLRCTLALPRRVRSWPAIQRGEFYGHLYVHWLGSMIVTQDTVFLSLLSTPMPVE